MKIYTLTLNPAYDIHAFAEVFEACHENLACVQSREAGGKGVNISRALCSAGVPNTGVIVLGKENCGDFKEALARDGIECILFEKAGRIRENLTLHCANGPETRISFLGFRADDSVLDEIMQKLQVDQDTVITFTGRVPAGIHMDRVKAFLGTLQLQGAKLVLDSKSFSLADICEIKPWLIKPNQEELSEYFGCNVESVSEAMVKAAEFSDRGVTNVMVSLGAQGALLMAGGKTYMAQPPKIQAVSTIGAGDSSIAGFLAAALRGRRAGECLRSAVAFGTAACLTEGSRPPRKADVDRLYTQVKLTQVK